MKRLKHKQHPEFLVSDATSQVDTDRSTPPATVESQNSSASIRSSDTHDWQANEADGFEITGSFIAKDEDKPVEDNLVRKFAFLGIMFLSLTIAGDTMRIAEETYAFHYENGDPEVRIGIFGQLFVLSISSCMSVIGTLGLVLLFSLTAQVAHVSRILLTNELSTMRTITADEARFVHMMLPDDGN